MIRRDYLWFGGVDSRDYGVLLTAPAVEDAPERELKMTSIPGRDGDLLQDLGRWKNIPVRYQAAIVRDFDRNFSALRARLLAVSGYSRLEDSFHPGEYRVGCLPGPIQPKTTPFNRAGEFTVEFNCKPQRFLKSGERSVTLSAPGALYNPTAFAAKPLITVYGTGSGRLSAGGVTALLNDIDGYVTLDCDLQNAYKDTLNKNNTISAPDFPALPPGRCEITWTGGISRVEIIPRWWTL